jgi:hypothetical protein
VFITAVPNTKLRVSVRDTLLCRCVCVCVFMCVFITAVCVQYLIQSCARGGRRIVEDMCYEIRQAKVCVD